MINSSRKGVMKQQGNIGIVENWNAVFCVPTIPFFLPSIIPVF
jgi:hypothetical protein